MKASRILRAVMVLIGLAVFFLIGRAKPETPAQPFFRHELKSYGFPVPSEGQLVGNYTDINFLSDNLVLVSVNTRTYGSVEPLDSDQPPSKLVLFDVARNVLVKTTDSPVEKRKGSVKSTHGGKFVLFNEFGVNFCSQELECRAAIASSDPIFVSPKGNRLIVGGNGQTSQRLVDFASTKQLEQFAWGDVRAVPGDNGILICRHSKLYVRMPDSPERQMPFGGGGIWPDARFLNDKDVADFASTDSLAVARLDGTILYSKPVKQRWHLAEILTTASGSRFCFHEAGYTKLNSAVNFLDIDSGRPFNTQTITVFEAESGQTVLNLEWDPRPYVGPLSSPALSPDGHSLAVMHGSFLEVYRIP